MPRSPGCALEALRRAEVDATQVGRGQGDSGVAQNANTAVSVTSGQRRYSRVGRDSDKRGRMPIHILLLLVLLAGWAMPSPERWGTG